MFRLHQGNELES